MSRPLLHYFSFALVLKLLQLESVVAHCVECDSSLKTHLIFAKVWFDLQQSYAIRRQTISPGRLCRREGQIFRAKRNFPQYRWQQTAMYLLFIHEKSKIKEIGTGKMQL